MAGPYCRVLVGAYKRGGPVNVGWLAAGVLVPGAGDIALQCHFVEIALTAFRTMKALSADFGSRLRKQVRRRPIKSLQDDLP